MPTAPNRLERRAAQRFDHQVRVAVQCKGGTQIDLGFTQDISARGAFFFTQLPLEVGDEVELTLIMPSEIAMAENARVRCSGRVIRTAASATGGRGVAVALAGYEFLPEEADQGVSRVAALHQNRYSPEEKTATLHATAR
jgi:hypothetical protein